MLTSTSTGILIVLDDVQGARGDSRITERGMLLVIDDLQMRLASYLELIETRSAALGLM